MPCDEQRLDTLVQHIDELDGQLDYYLGRIKVMPSEDMVQLIQGSIRERLQQMRELAQYPR